MLHDTEVSKGNTSLGHLRGRFAPPLDGYIFVKPRI